MKFKKIYIEITNICNLNCSFCSPSKRLKKSITTEQFEEILKKIDDYTDYIYLHVKGEPLLHKDLEKLLDLSHKYNKQVNITTNGTFIKEKASILNHKAVRQINISLHSENNKDNYLNDIFEAVDLLSNKIIVLRYWTLKNQSDLPKIVDDVFKHYNINEKEKNHIKIRKDLYLDRAEEFIWPSLDNDYYNENGYCYALKDQLAILVDGTVVPCCLDGEGIINLGNIYKTTMDIITTSERFTNMKKCFSNRKACEELCKRCSFKNRLLKNK